MPNAELFYTVVRKWENVSQNPLESFHSSGQQPYKFYWRKNCDYIKKSEHPQDCFAHQHDRLFSVSEHQYGCRDVMWKRFIDAISSQGLLQVLRVIEITYVSLIRACNETILSPFTV